MKTQWKERWVKVTIWLALEVILNLLGLDNLADYSEFIFEQESAICLQQGASAIAAHQTRMIDLVPPHYPTVDCNMPYRFTMALSA